MERKLLNKQKGEKLPSKIINDSQQLGKGKKIHEATKIQKEVGGEQDLQKINRVYSFKGCRHRHLIVQANYQWKIITPDGFGVSDFSYSLQQMMKCEI